LDVAIRLNVLRLGFATAALQPQRGCIIQPGVGAQRLRWVNGQNENNALCSDRANRERRQICERESGFDFGLVRVVRG
jgi:hypothetical protein